ncbi:MAG: aromatic amino acid exporter YddG [Gemmobacter sp.]
MTRTRATLIGFTAILMWALLALLTVLSKPVPPFQLTALCFGISAAIGLIWTASTGRLGVLLTVPWYVYAIGTAGLFGTHAMYFTIIRLAEPEGATAQAGLIAYLWPLLIVLLSGLLPDERLRPLHLIGAALAFAGAALIVLRPGGQIGGGALPALALAFVYALTWAAYSVNTRRFADVPTVSVAVVCLAAAVLSVPMHLAFEATAWPTGTTGWLAVGALGLGPVGLAFFAWDVGMKQGDIQLLGVASYAAPLLSTTALMVAGIAPATPLLLVAAILIAGGAVVAARAKR